VKGAYWDYETVIAAQNHWPVPVFTKKWQTDANYEKLTEFLLANVDWLVPAFGSHNIRSISHAMAVAEQLKVPPRRYEFQMLYGMADAIKESIQSLGHRVRIYTPYGQLLPGMAYLVRRLLENSSNDSFLRQGFAEGLSEEVLLMNPNDHAKNPAPQPPPPGGEGEKSGGVGLPKRTPHRFLHRSESRRDEGGARRRSRRVRAHVHGRHRQQAAAGDENARPREPVSQE
jgi:RHH-type proline utilization regulon transcriptional repressor/proline dehydrogenase/delta 1-pyrroline-5-carboxylate dehydrogenase